MVERAIGKFLLKQRLHHLLQLQPLLALLQESFHCSFTGALHQVSNTAGKVPGSSANQNEAEIVTHILLDRLDRGVSCGERNSWWDFALESSASSNTSGKEIPVFFGMNEL